MVCNVPLLRRRVSDARVRLAVAEQELAEQRIVLRYMRQTTELKRKQLETERALSAKQHLELQTASLEQQLKVMQHMGDDEAVQKRIEEITEEFAIKTAELAIKTAELNSVEELFSQWSQGLNTPENV